MAYGSTYLVAGLLSSPNYKCLRTWKMSAHTRGNLEDFPKKIWSHVAMSRTV